MGLDTSVSRRVARLNLFQESRSRGPKQCLSLLGRGPRGGGGGQSGLRQGGEREDMEKTASPRQPWHPSSPTQKGAEGLPSTPDADSLTQPACRESLDSDLRYHYLRWMGQAPGMGAHTVLTTPPEEGLRALISPRTTWGNRGSAT